MLLTLLLTLAALCEGSRVLIVLPLGSKSHKNIVKPLANALGQRGHEVTLVSLHAAPNNVTRTYTDVAATDAWSTIRKVTGNFDVFKIRETSGGKNVNSQVMTKVLRHVSEYCDAFLRDPGVQSAWAVKPDLIILPAFMNECGLALVHKFKVPFIYVTTSGLTPWTADLVGNPENPAYIPNQYLSYGAHMTLWERTVNTLVRLATPYLRSHLVLSRLDGVVQRFLADPTVSLSEVEQNVSLVLVNSHYSLGHPRPLLPNVVEVAAMHCRPTRPLLDHHLRHFLDSSPTPVIVFSLGSSIKSEQIPTAVRQTLVEAFRRLPYRIVWKWEGSTIPNLPSNVLTRPWLPQQDVLGHPNVRAFLTHGGLLSLQEAVYHNVPMVGLPIMSDQHLNIRQATTLGIALELSWEKLTKDAIEETLTRIIKDEGYSRRMQQRSLMLQDQETSPLDRAVYWTEHILQHGGGQHLRSSVIGMPIHQYLLLDVMVVLVVVALIILIFLWWTLKALARALLRTTEMSLARLLSNVRVHMKLQ